MATIKLKLDAERLTLDDLITLESGNLPAVFMRDFLARFVLDGNGEYMEAEAARKLVGALTLLELRDTTNQFGEGVKELQAALVPPVSASE